jgi:hypothetical protein
VLPVAGEAQKQEFSYMLSKQAYHSVSEGHLWFSIFSRLPSNRFTRVQRCTCCFVLLLTSMLLSTLYYDQAAEAKADQATEGLRVGPLYVTTQQVSLLDASIALCSIQKLDRRRCDRGDPLVLAQHSARPVLSTHSIATCWPTAISPETSNSTDQATASTKDEETIGVDVSVVVSVHRLWSVSDDGSSVDLLHHRSWHRVWRCEMSEVAHFSAQ